MNEIIYWTYLYAALFNVDPTLSLAVIKTESNFNPAIVGDRGEIGLMQLMPQYVPVPRQKLFNIRENIKQGVKRLAEAKKSCKHKAALTWVVCYNTGMTGAERIRHPEQQTYYQRVMKEYREMKKNFKTNQKVIVLNAHAFGADLPGIIIKPSVERFNQGKYLVDMGFTKMNVEPERLVDEKEYLPSRKKEE